MTEAQAEAARINGANSTARRWGSVRVYPGIQRDGSLCPPLQAAEDEIADIERRAGVEAERVRVV